MDWNLKFNEYREVINYSLDRTNNSAIDQCNTWNVMYNKYIVNKMSSAFYSWKNTFSKNKLMFLGLRQEYSIFIVM